MLGGALISLSLRFPEESRQIELRPWLLGVPYGISLALTAWGLAAMNSSNPWAYIPSRYAVYLYTVLGVVGFLGTMFYRARSGHTGTIRRQARIVLLGSALSFAPVTLWLVATVVGPKFKFDVALLLPPLIIFPLSVALAIFRYRLLEVDAIVNRTILYGLVTAVLAGVISVSMSLTQNLFLAVTGERSDAAAVITTLIVVSAFEPLKSRVRALVERLFKQEPDTTQELRSFGSQIHSFLLAHDAEQITQRLLGEAAQGLRAQSAVLSLSSNGELRPSHIYGPWRGEAWMAVPLEWQGERYGLLSIGPRLDRQQYTRRECELLQQVANQVAGAIHLSRM
jgi:hypothetical protein